MTVQSPSQLSSWSFRQVAWATFVLVFVAFCFWILYRFNQVVFVVFIALVMGTVIRPVVTWLYWRGIPRAAGVILVCLVLFALIIGFVLLLFPLIIDQGSTISSAVTGYYLSLRAWMVNNPDQLVVRLGAFLPPKLPGLDPVQQTGQELLASAGQVWGYLILASKATFTTIAIFLLAIHWTLDGPRTIQSLLVLIPKEKRENIHTLISDMESKVYLYIAGQSLLCLIIGILSLIAYLLIGLPNALILALVAGVLEAVPMIGPLLGAIPAAVIALSIAPSKLVWVIVATLVIQQLENNLLVPRVMRKAVGVNPFVSLLAIFAFNTLFGIAGALMAIPLAAIIQLLLDRYVFQTAVIEAETSTGRDFASLLRYETQNLAQDLRKQARLKKGGSSQRVKKIDQVMDEIESITTDLDSLLAQTQNSGSP